MRAGRLSEEPRRDVEGALFRPCPAYGVIEGFETIHRVLGFPSTGNGMCESTPPRNSVLEIPGG